MKPEEAKQKYCPFTLPTSDPKLCLGDECMAWEELSTKSPQSEGHGFCSKLKTGEK